MREKNSSLRRFEFMHRNLDKKRCLRIPYQGLSSISRYSNFYMAYFIPVFYIFNIGSFYLVPYSQTSITCLNRLNLGTPALLECTMFVQVKSWTQNTVHCYV